MIKTRICVLESELESIQVVGVSAIAYDVKSSKTNKIDRPTENEAMKLSDRKAGVEKELFLLRHKKDIIDSALLCLNERERIVVVRRVIENYPFGYICNELHISESYAHRIKNLALKKLSRIIVIGGKNKNVKVVY